MATLNALELGKKALLAQKFGLDATSSNIANINTKGYSRRIANFSETSPLLTKDGFIGTGVLAQSLQSFRNEYFDSEIRRSLSQQKSYESDVSVFQRIEAFLAEPSDIGMNEIVSQFFNAFQNLASDPESEAQRNIVVDLAKTMVDRFHSVSQQLSDARNNVLSEMETNVEKANELIKQITELNKQIVTSNAQSTGDAQTYIDQRAVALEDLSELVGITVSTNDNGSANVYIGGMNVITGSIGSTLQLSEIYNSATGERSISISRVDESGNVLNTLPVQSGEISSMLKHYNVTLDNRDSSGGFSIAKKLDEFANAIVTKVNALTITGYGLDDTGATPVGRSFFTPAVGGATAANIAISDEILSSSRNIPLSDVAGEPANNNIARQIAQLSSDSSFLDGMTPSEFYSGVISRLGSLQSEAINGQSATELVTEQLTNQRESLIGVNLDEEAVNLIKFQKAFEAASQIITTTNDILTTIVNLGR